MAVACDGDHHRHYAVFHAPVVAVLYHLGVVLNVLFVIPDATRSQGWTIFYTPALIAFLSIPMFHGWSGTVRPMLGGVLLVIAVIMVFRSYKRGWKVDPTDADDHRLTEG